MPDGYGVEAADSFIEWREVQLRLVDSHHYWLSTTRRDGSPHVVPRWGVWLDGRLWYDGSPETVHARNLAHDARCALHLESGAEVTIVEGRSDPSHPLTGDFAEAVAAEYARKYGPVYTPGRDAWSGADAGGMRVVTPIKAIAWSNFPRDVTRFKF